MRVFKWILLGVLLAGSALVGATLWQEHRWKTEFPTLPPGARQLAIFDAFSWHVIHHYYDRKFVDEHWEALRAKWRLEAAKATNDVYLYNQVFVPLSQLLPSSHISALPPATVYASVAAAAGPAPTTATLAGRGFEIASIRRNGGVRYFVGDVTPGSPAAQAGIEPGWQINSLPDGNADPEVGVFMTAGTPAERLAYEATGHADIRNDLAIKNEADFYAAYLRRISFRHITRAPRPLFETRRLAGGVTYIRLDTFMDTQAMDQALSAFDGASAAGVILDLRVNNGGHVSEEIRLLARLLPPNALTGTEITTSGSSEWRVGDGKRYPGPLIVLVGPDSASAAEVVSAALQDHKRARLLGRSTAGATLVSDTFPLPDGGKAQIAYADFIRPNGKRIEGIGVMPDIPLMSTLSDVRAGRDAALERALAELVGAG